MRILRGTNPNRGRSVQDSTPGARVRKEIFVGRGLPTTVILGNPVSEKRASRKLACIHSHTYPVPGRIGAHYQVVGVAALTPGNAVG